AADDCSGIIEEAGGPLSDLPRVDSSAASSYASNDTGKCRGPPCPAEHGNARATAVDSAEYPLSDNTDKGRRCRRVDPAKIRRGRTFHPCAVGRTRLGRR